MASARFWVCLPVLVLLAACGADLPPSSAIDQAKTDSAQDGLARLYTEIVGTPAERHARSRAARYGAWQAMADCVHEAGLAYPAFDEQPVSAERPLGVGYTDRWLAPITIDWLVTLVESEAVSDLDSRQRVFAPGPYPNGSAADKAYMRAVLSCEKSVAPERDVDTAEFPSGYWALLRPYRAMVDEVQSGLDVYRSAYRRCMRDRDLKVHDYGDVGQRQWELLSSAKRGAPIPGVRKATTAWRTNVAQAQRWARADAQCRKGVHDRGFATLEPKVAEFRRVHARELSAIHREWQAS